MEPSELEPEETPTEKKTPDFIFNRPGGGISFVPGSLVDRTTITKHVPQTPLYIIEDKRVVNEIYRIKTLDVYVFPLGSITAQEEFEARSIKEGRTISRKISRQMRRAIDRALEKREASK